MMAPKKVPAERMDEMRDFSQAGRVKAAFSASVASGPGMGIPVCRLIKLPRQEISRTVDNGTH
jgi:homoserine dehydrogenase